MIDIYLAGVAVVIVKDLFFHMRSAFSTYAANMKRIGLPYAWNGNYEQEKPSPLVVAALVLLNSLLSWLEVLWSAWRVLRARTANRATPAELKPIYERLRRTALTRDQVIECFEEVYRLQGKFGPVPGVAADVEAPWTLSLDPWPSRVEVRPDKGLLEWRGFTDDMLGSFFETEEYRFDGTELLVRLLSKHSEHAGSEPWWYVQDGAVLETAVRERTTRIGIGDADEEVDELRQQVA